jgi:uncharacterized membrane protein YciS (DUF1049 family)
MKVVKWCIIFAAGFAVSWILIFTFTQEPFKALAPAKVFWYNTSEIPIVAFVAITFGIGLLIGFFAAAYYYIAGQAGIRGKKKVIKELEGVVEAKNREIARIESAIGTREKEVERLEAALKAKDQEIGELKAAAGQPKGRKTGSMKAVGEKDLFA